jgi:hypothetical protein
MLPKRFFSFFTFLTSLTRLSVLCIAYFLRCILFLVWFLFCFEPWLFLFIGICFRSSHRAASLRQLSSNFSQFNNLHSPLRSRKPLTRKVHYNKLMLYLADCVIFWCKKGFFSSFYLIQRIYFRKLRQ